eukprot:7848418-Alexandrium_andersonii.AAC.1
MDLYLHKPSSLSVKHKGRCTSCPSSCLPRAALQKGASRAEMSAKSRLVSCLAPCPRQVQGGESVPVKAEVPPTSTHSPEASGEAKQAT